MMFHRVIAGMQRVVPIPPETPSGIVREGFTIATDIGPSWSIDIPAEAVVGTYLTLHIGSDTGIVESIPDWTQITKAVSEQGCYVYGHVVDGSEGDTLTGTLGDAYGFGAVMCCWSGVDLDNPVDVFTAAHLNSDLSSPMDIPATTSNTHYAQCAIVWTGQVNDESGSGGITTGYVPPSGYSAIMYSGTTSYSSIGVAYAIQESIGATGTITGQGVMTEASHGWMAIMIALKPAPPPTGFAPEDMTVVVNSDDAESADMASDYATAKGIPSGNIITLSLGSSSACNSTQAAALYSAINAAGREATQLCMRFPTETAAGQSITSVATFGVRATTDLTVSELYNTSSLKPYTDNGRRPSAILLDSAYRMDDVVLNDGTSYMVLANDPDRTPARSAQQSTDGIVALDSEAAGAGGGASLCNQLSNNCWIGGFMDALEPVNMYFASVHNFVSDDDTVVFRQGFYGDSVSSFWGDLPTPADSQTPLTWFLDRGASMSCGTVEEPYQDADGNSDGSVTEQFVDISIFRPLFVANAPVGVCCWAGIKCPDRVLVAGDLMFQAQFTT